MARSVLAHASKRFREKRQTAKGEVGRSWRPAGLGSCRLIHLLVHSFFLPCATQSLQDLFCKGGREHRGVLSAWVGAEPTPGPA